MTATLKCSHTSPEWTATTLPPALRHCHCAPHGQFAQWQVLSGTLTMEWLDDTDQVMSTYEASSQQPLPIVPPHQAHRIARVSDDLRCQLSLLCALEDYGHVVHGMTCTHSEVVHAFQHTGPESPLRVLDLGCGGGRNTLYMALKGHHVTAVDHNPSSLKALDTIVQNEGIAEHVDIQQVDLNHYAISGEYDALISTVVMMFLQPETPARLIRDMQTHTPPGGYNLIVVAMSTDDYPCPMPFPFTFSAGELSGYYTEAGWTIEHYNEDVGELHRTDAAGNRIALRFATLLARRPA